ncbi:hypothetical protein PR048_026168 [Dryococelus australis]|uniref:Uncharacterized protein n=1 Tax=Dryococelus australis TaxID=614101 RepID=A0ABQ9GKN4_9NEOP|nr:hypothetical protein PR048_026168 [Dryococelus australis]
MCTTFFHLHQAGRQLATKATIGTHLNYGPTFISIGDSLDVVVYVDADCRRGELEAAPRPSLRRCQPSQVYGWRLAIVRRYLRSSVITRDVLNLRYLLVTGSKWSNAGEIPEKTHRPTASSGTIPTCGNPVTRPGIESGSPWWEASGLTGRPPRPLSVLELTIVILVHTTPDTTLYIIAFIIGR